MTEIKDKVVLITGASGGLGQEMIKQFLEEKALLILTDINIESLKLTVNSVLHKNGMILGLIESDLSTKEGCEKLYKETLDITNKLDILINNAGIAYVGNFLNLPEDKMEKIMDINILAPMRITKKFLPLMIKNNFGHIVNISSIAGILGARSLVAYSASKFAIKGFGEALFNDLKEKGIKVTNICPHFTRTNILHSEQFGYKKQKVVPDFILSEPSTIVKKIIQGIKKEKLNVFPGFYSKFTYLISKYFPSILNLATNLYIKKEIREENFKN